MQVQDIARHRRAQPFKPFWLHLSDGRFIAVRHSECVAWFPGQNTVPVMQPDGEWDTIDMRHVVSVDDRPSPNGNGAHKKRRKSA